jgi:hypothetical protein
MSKIGSTYAGSHEGGKAHGFGVYEGSDGGPDTISGQFANLNGRLHGHGPTGTSTTS